MPEGEGGGKGVEIYAKKPKKSRFISGFGRGDSSSTVGKDEYTQKLYEYAKRTPYTPTDADDEELRLFVKIMNEPISEHVSIHKPIRLLDQNGVEINSDDESDDTLNGWETISGMERKLGAAAGTVRRIIQPFEAVKPEWIRHIQKGKLIFHYYHPDLVSILETQLQNRDALPPDGWKSTFGLAKDTSRTTSDVLEFVKTYQFTHPEWFRFYTKEHAKIMSVYYHPDLVRLAGDGLKTQENGIGPDWIPVIEFSRATIHSAVPKVQRKVAIYGAIHPDWVKMVNTSMVKGHPSQFIHRDLAKILERQLEHRTEIAPEDWLSVEAMAKQSGGRVLFHALDTYRVAYPDLIREYALAKGSRAIEYLHPDLIAIIGPQIENWRYIAPQNWESKSDVARKLHLLHNRSRIEQLVEPYRITHPDYFRYYKSNIFQNKNAVYEHFHPDLVALIFREIATQRENAENTKVQKQGQRVETIDRNNNEVVVTTIVDSIVEISLNSSLAAKDFFTLISFCGSSKSADILFRLYPDYKKIPIDYVKNVLAEYLGDYLAVKRPFQLKDITPEIAQHFSDLTLKEGLKETIKQDCLSFYYKERRMGSKKTDRQVIEAYLDHAVNELGDLKNKDIDDVVEEVVEFFNKLFSNIERPRHMVDRLGDDRREFPDVNQRINYQELKDKKRLLIADEMGLGKSGSVIFAKEALGAKLAVLVVPSNVIPTWQKYLSDSRADGGYFKAGLQPSVLTVENLEALQRAGVADREYIIISHERLAEEGYAEELLKLDIDMLVADEAHLLKNLQGKRAMKFVELSKKIEGEDKYLALLSGTPVPNTVKDIAMTLKLLYPEKFSETEDRNLVSGILKGDLLDLRSLLLPRMQMKSLRESVEMPELHEKIVYTELEGLERDIYEMLLEEDELTPTAKLQILRQFLLNAESVDPTPGLESSKIESLNELLAQIYQTKKKVVVFVNGFVEDVLRGEKGIISKLHVPPGVEISAIHGEVAKNDRIRLQTELKDSKRKMLLLVNGQTAGVGVDFSSADEVIHYNEPWTQYDKNQQLSRVYRPGLKHDLSSSTLIGKGTIEEGIHKHIAAKYKSIEKLLNGIPLTEIEQEMLRATDDEGLPTSEVSPELARYYFSSWERMMSIFAHVKEIGEVDFQKFLGTFSREYADCYMELGSRSYQANANRVTGSLIADMAKESGRTPNELVILDTASGPEMLRRHIPDAFREHVVSMDMNSAHFQQGEGKRVVGSFLHIPLRADSVDYAAMTLAWHYTNFVPGQGKIERVQVLKEIHGVLKPGGRAILNLMYSLDIRKPENLKPALERMGFKVVDEYSGEISERDKYASKIVTIEKVRENTETPEQITAGLVEADLVDGLKFRQNDRGLRNSRGILTSFVLNGKKREIPLNEHDKAIYEEERALLDRGEKLKDRYDDIQGIPREEVVRGGFSRVFNGKRYVLFSKLSKGPGVVVIK